MHLYQTVFEFQVEPSTPRKKGMPYNLAIEGYVP